jgi:hypothetical protein
MLDACAALMREFGCSVLLVHHTGVSEEAQHRARGSSAWRGALDIEISIVPAKDGQPLEIVQRKQKDGELAEPLYARIEGLVIPDWFDEDGEPVKSATLVLVDAPVRATASDKVLAKHCKLFEDAWLKVGEEIDGVPYISKSALRDYIDEVIFEGKGANKPANMVNVNQEGKLINRLVSSNMIKPESHGWVVIDQNMSNMMRLLKVG